MLIVNINLKGHFMFNLETISSLFFFFLLMFGTPGPAVIALTISGMQIGFKKSLPFLFGIFVGAFFTFLVAFAGVGTILLSFNWLYKTLQIIGALYMCYLAWKIATSPTLNISNNNNLTTFSFTKGILLNVLNPKCYTIAFAGFLSFSNSNHYFLSSILIITIGMLCVFFTQPLWCYFGSLFKRIFSNSKWNRIINIFLGTVMLITVIFAIFVSK